MSDMPPLMQFYFYDGQQQQLQQQQQQGQKVMESVEEIMKGFKPNPDLSMSQMTSSSAPPYGKTETVMTDAMLANINFTNEELSNINFNDFMVEFE